MSQSTHLDIEFSAPDGVTLRGALYVPDGPGRHPAVTMTHGYGAVKEMALLRLAAAFAEAGFAALVHDHRTFGASDGTPRQDIDPWKQIEDWRRAITYLESRPEVDADRIGLWGSSYAGGHAIVLGASDRRLKAVVAQVPTISGFEQSRRRVAPDDIAALEAALDSDERAQAAGEAPRTQALASADPGVAAAYRAQDAVDFYLQELPEGTRWDNSVTVRSTRKARMYEPGVFIDRVSPTPLLMIVGRQDTVTLTDTGLAAFNRALEPKRLVTIPGGHFAPYTTEFARASAAAIAFFREHLAPNRD
ncbi:MULTISPECIES: alpha/beta hydrolase [Streptomyces]|uniref:alpha/beta hydrolase n=1 Tax=Streptomyces lycopersici TaxID=2974589 RepID=UPI0021CFC022|nr:alpha/beta hydrolase [Streptomyces sp. NEAU-383]